MTIEVKYSCFEKDLICGFLFNQGEELLTWIHIHLFLMRLNTVTKPVYAFNV